MVLVFKAVNRTEPVYLQTLVRPHTPVRALHSSTSAGRLVPPSLSANKAAQRSHDSSLFWSLRGGTNSRPASGQQSLCVCSRRLRTHLFRVHLNPTVHDSPAFFVNYTLVQLYAGAAWFCLVCVCVIVCVSVYKMQMLIFFFFYGPTNIHQHHDSFILVNQS